MPSAAGGVIDRSVGHSAFRILPTVPQPTSADFIPQITFRISANYQHPLLNERVKEGYPLKRRYFATTSSYSSITAADKYRHAVFHNKHW